MTMRCGGLNDDGPGTDDDWMRVAPDNGNLKEVVQGRGEASVYPSQRVVLRELSLPGTALSPNHYKKS